MASGAVLAAGGVCIRLTRAMSDCPATIQNYEKQNQHPKINTVENCKAQGQFCSMPRFSCVGQQTNERRHGTHGHRGRCPKHPLAIRGQKARGHSAMVRPLLRVVRGEAQAGERPSSATGLKGNMINDGHDLSLDNIRRSRAQPGSLKRRGSASLLCDIESAVVNGQKLEG